MRATVTASAAALLALACFSAVAQQPAMMDKSRTGVALDEFGDWDMCSPDGVAIGGYDLVSYRQEGGPVLGDKELTAEHDGKVYRFSSKENLRAFQADRKKYLPRYGGFCAVTLALGRVTCPDYTNFRIEDGSLLLFEITGFTNGRALWETDASGFRVKADGNFRQILELR